MMQFGYYGKTVHRGDFVRFNLPQTFVNVWDDWLQLVIADAESRHTQNWNEIYQKSEAYRFALSAGIAGEPAWIGIMWPSTDKVGRKFPFCLTLSLPEHISPITHARALDPIYDRLQELVNNILQPEYDFDSLQETMSAMITTLTPVVDAAHAPRFAASDPTNNLSILSNSNSLLVEPERAITLLDAVLQQTWFSYSLWHSIREPDSTLLSCGMPMGDTAVALFDSAWPAAESGRLDCDNFLVSDHNTRDGLVEDRTQAIAAETESAADSDAVVVAFEPSPENIEAMRESLESDMPEESPEELAELPEVLAEKSAENFSRRVADQPNVIVLGDGSSDELSHEPSEKPTKPEIDFPNDLPEDFKPEGNKVELETTSDGDNSLDPKVERLELDDEFAEQDPWDKD